MKNACSKSALKQGQVSLPCDLLLSALFEHRYCRQYFTFHEFEECAAASGDVGDFVSNAEQVDCCQSVAAASDGERFAVCDSVSHDFSTFAEVREFEHANRTVPQNGFRILQDFSQFLSGSIADIGICSSAFTSLTDFRVAGAVSENSVATRTSDGTGMLQVVSRRLASSTVSASYRIYPHRGLVPR